MPSPDRTPLAAPSQPSVFRQWRELSGYLPALASGGAVLAGLPATAVAAQAAVALFLLHHFARPAPEGH